MKNLTLENLTKVCGGVYFGPSDKLEQEVSSITTDSRKAEAGTLFVPIVGERVDAHKFIPQVMEAGALATLSERILENADFPYIKVCLPQADPSRKDGRRRTWIADRPLPHEVQKQREEALHRHGSIAVPVSNPE